MKLSHKSEWFDLPSPIGEPELCWKNNEIYRIERSVKSGGEIIWYGIDTNWKCYDGKWTKLSNPFNTGVDFYPCDEPIYETLYKSL